MTLLLGSVPKRNVSSAMVSVVPGLVPVGKNLASIKQSLKATNNGKLKEKRQTI